MIIKLFVFTKKKIRNQYLFDLLYILFLISLLYHNLCNSKSNKLKTGAWEEQTIVQGMICTDSSYSLSSQNLLLSSHINFKLKPVEFPGVKPVVPLVNLLKYFQFPTLLLNSKAMLKSLRNHFLHHPPFVWLPAYVKTEERSSKS